MDCPKCKIQNPDDAKTCSACGAELTNIAQPKKMCSLALWSFILTLCTPVLVFSILEFIPIQNSFELTVLLATLLTVLAFLFAIFALIRIGKSNGTQRGLGFAIASISIIIIGFVLFVLPVLQKARIKKPNLKPSQKNQFHTIEIALELFNSDNGHYPPSSDTLDPNARPYCGAMKFCGALLGQDLRGFHPDSFILLSTGYDGLYGTRADIVNFDNRWKF
jgi:hypothetical protein